MFTRKRTKRTVRGAHENPEYTAIVQSLSPHLNNDDHAKWWRKWQADQLEFQQSPFLRVVSFANEVSQAHGLDHKTRRKIRDSLCKSLLTGSKHTAA